MSRQRQKKRTAANQNQKQQPKINGRFIRSVKPLTENQNLYVDSFHDNIVTICRGPSGSGKTILAVNQACQWLHHGEIDRIIMARAMVGCGKDMGAFPGDMYQKLSPYVSSSVEYFENFLGKERAHSLLKENIINITPVEMVRGQTYKNSVMILEEAQNCSLKQLKLFMSRIGEDSTLIILGDEKQSDTNSNSISFLFEHFQGILDIGLITLTYKDILRHPIIPDILAVFDKHDV